MSATCSCCQASLEAVAFLIQGKKGLYFCDGCVYRATRATPSLAVPGQRCALCPQQKNLIMMRSAHDLFLCQQCLDLCVEIIADACSRFGTPDPAGGPDCTTQTGADDVLEQPCERVFHVGDGGGMSCWRGKEEPSAPQVPLQQGWHSHLSPRSHMRQNTSTRR